MVLCPRWRNTWRRELIHGSKCGPTFHHSHWPTWVSCASHSLTLGTTWSDVPLFKGEVFPTGSRKIPVVPEVLAGTWSFQLLEPNDKLVTEKGVTILALVINPDYWEKGRLLVYNGNRKKYVWHPCDPHAQAWGKWTNATKVWRSQGKQRLRMVRIMPTGKPPKLAEGEGNLGWIMEEGDGITWYLNAIISSASLSYQTYSYKNPPWKETYWNPGSM